MRVGHGGGADEQRTCASRARLSRCRATRYLKLSTVARRPTGPRAWNLPVAMPISPPKPNSPPSANWVEALCSRMALSISVKKRCRRSRVLGDDRLGMMRAVVADMGDGRADIVDDLHRDDRRPRIRCASPPRSRAWRRGRAPRRSRRRGSRSPLAIRASMTGFRCVADHVLVDQQRFGRAADAGAAHLGVERDLTRHVELGGLVDEGVAEALEVGENRHARFVLDARHQRLAAARHDHVDDCRRGPRSISPTAARSVVGTSWMASAAGPAASRPCDAGRRGWRAVRVRLSEPPRRITALPDLSVRARRHRR